MYTNILFCLFECPTAFGILSAKVLIAGLLSFVAVSVPIQRHVHQSIRDTDCREKRPTPNI